MALGELNKCWVCWESEACKKDSDLKQFCTPIRGKKGTLCERMLIWLCGDCKRKYKYE